jgi:hypothetical protein
MKARSLTNALLTLALSMNAADNPASTEVVHVLSAGDLRVEIATDTRRLEKAYGPRFDRSAVVVSVKRKGIEFVEARGLCDEFGLRGLGVLGYADAAVGVGEFLKIGVGVLRRDHAGDYTFVRHWPVAASLPVEVVVGADELAVTQRSPLRHGFAYKLSKRYQVQAEGTLLIEYELANSGMRSFAFEHYNHNFLNLGATAIDTSFQVTPGFALPEPGNAGWQEEKGGLRLTRPAPPRGGVVFGVEVSVPAEMNWLRVTREGGASVEIAGDFPLARFAVWATEAALCPELFYRSEIAVGASVRWSHRYRFQE